MQSSAKMLVLLPGEYMKKQENSDNLFNGGEDGYGYKDSDMLHVW